jgi:hypothetical protein
MQNLQPAEKGRTPASQQSFTGLKTGRYQPRPVPSFLLVLANIPAPLLPVRHNFRHTLVSPATGYSLTFSWRGIRPLPASRDRPTIKKCGINSIKPRAAAPTGHSLPYLAVDGGIHRRQVHVLVAASHGSLNFIESKETALKRLRLRHQRE